MPAIRVEPVLGGVRLTIDRPERRNSLDTAALGELHRALDAAERDPACRLVLLTGRDGVFCTGMDLAAAANGPSVDGGQAFFDLLRRFTTTPLVVVSTVDGQVAGGGVGLAAASDLVYATGRSTFALPEALWGLLPCCVLPFLVRRVGFQKAYAMTLSTQPVGAVEAAGCALVDEVSEGLDEPVRRLAYRLDKLDVTAIGEAKRYFGRLWGISADIERTAVAELGRLMAAPAVRHRLAEYASTGRYPWEGRR